MKNIAICYSGQPRRILETFSNHYENIIEPNVKEYNIHIFAHIWTNNLKKEIFFCNEIRQNGKWPDNIEFNVENTWNPKAVKYEETRFFTSSFLQPDSRFHPANNVLSMFYSMNKVSKIQQDYAKQNKIFYDYVIRMRSDLMFLKPIGEIKKYNQNFIHIKQEKNPHTDYSLNDYFAIGNQKNMNNYFSVYENLEDLIKEGCMRNPECLLGFNLLIKNITPIQLHDFNIIK